MPHSCVESSGFGQALMFRTLEGSSKDRGTPGAAAVDHVSPAGGGLAYHPRRAWVAGPGHESAVCGCAGLGVGGARQRVGPPIAVLLRARGDKDRMSMGLVSPSSP